MNIMKLAVLHAAFLSGVLVVNSGVPSLPFTQSAEVSRVTAGSSQEVQFIYHGFATLFPDPSEQYYGIGFSLIPTNSAAPLRASVSQIDFSKQESVGPGREVFLTDGGANRLGIITFDQVSLGHGAPWRYFDVGSNAPRNTLYYKARSLTEVLVGYRFQEEDGFHYGWVRFARSDTTFTNIFDLVAHDWHPIPDAPIGAGQPPEIPLAAEVVDDGAGGRLLRVGWHPAVATWSFETTDSLIPPVTWTENPAGGTSAEIPLDGAEAQRYFRLRRP